MSLSLARRRVFVGGVLALELLPLKETGRRRRLGETLAEVFPGKSWELLSVSRFAILVVVWMFGVLTASVAGYAAVSNRPVVVATATVHFAAVSDGFEVSGVGACRLVWHGGTVCAHMLRELIELCQ